VRLPAPQIEDVDLSRAVVHILRGPRQVGKSTDLKLLVRRALEAGVPARQIVYLSLDLFEDQPAAELVATVSRALELARRRPVGPRLILLDEVTAARNWRTSIKVLWDNGRIDSDVVVCTGSSAIDLAHGAAERLPGRRGAGRDILVLPQSFASFARALDPALPPGLGMIVAEITSEDGRAAVTDARAPRARIAVALGTVGLSSEAILAQRFEPTPSPAVGPLAASPTPGRSPTRAGGCRAPSPSRPRAADLRYTAPCRTIVRTC
jgi:AAA domain